MKSQAMDWEKIFAKYLPDHRHIFRIYKELPQSTIKENLIFKTMAIRADFTKEDIGISINTLKITQNHLSLRKTKLKLQFKKTKRLTTNKYERIWGVMEMFYSKIVTMLLLFSLGEYNCNTLSHSVGKESVCSAGDLGLIPESGRPAGEGKDSSILAWRISWAEDLVGYSPGSCKELDTTE